MQPFGMTEKQFAIASSIMALIVALAIMWKLFIELPKSWKSATTIPEKMSSLTILL